METETRFASYVVMRHKILLCKQSAKLEVCCLANYNKVFIISV